MSFCSFSHMYKPPHLGHISLDPAAFSNVLALQFLCISGSFLPASFSAIRSSSSLCGLVSVPSTLGMNEPQVGMPPFKPDEVFLSSPRFPDLSVLIGTLLVTTFLFMNLFCYGCAGSLLLCGLFSSCGERRHLSRCVRASHCVGFSCCGAQALGYTGSSSCHTWAQ